MTQAEFQTFLNFAILACAGLAVLNLLFVRKRGNRALVLAAAFLGLGATIYAYGQNGVGPLVYVGGMVVFLLLVVDIVMRTKPEETRKRQ